MGHDRYRMFALVAHNLPSLYKGVNIAKAMVNYIKNFGDTPEYEDWSKFDLDKISVLDGGFFNSKFDKDSGLPYGDMDKYLLQLEEYHVNVGTYLDPNANNGLTAIVFIVPSSVYATPSLEQFYGEKWNEKLHQMDLDPEISLKEKLSVFGDEVNSLEREWKKEWIDKVGSLELAWLKGWLQNFNWVEQ